MDCINGISKYLNKCHTLLNTSQTTFFSFRKIVHWCTCIAPATQSNCCGTLDFLSPAPCPPSSSAELNALITRLGSHTAAYKTISRELKRLKEIKERLVEFWQCTDTAFEWKKFDFRIFPFPGSAEAQLIWGGTVNHLLIAYFIGNISARNYQMCSPMSSYSKPKVGFFWDTV